MNKKNLKQLIKPIVKECINEVLLQEGVLSSIISEVMKGTSDAVLQERQPRVRESAKRVVDDHKNVMTKLQSQKTQKQQGRKKLLDAVGTTSYNGVNLFEGTEPLNGGGTPGSNAKPQGALSNYAPEDEGVDITGLMNLAGGSWKKIE